MAQATIAYVRWFDSAIYTGEACQPEELTGVSQIESAGLLIAEDRKSITLAVDRSLETGNIRLVLCIPKANVLSVQKFKASSEMSRISKG